MHSKLNIGVVGCGYWGPNLMRNFRSLSDCRLRAVCDTNLERLRHMQSLYPEATVYTDFAAFLKEAKLDAVVIATSVGQHYWMAKASLEAGKHVLVEKPMATSCAECDDLIALAKKKGLVLMASHTFLFSSVVRKIKQIVEDGDIGDVRYISARRLNLGLFQKEINVAWDLAPHDISIIQYIMGEMPQSVNCRGSANVSRGVHDITTMWLGFSRNRSAIIQSSWLDPRKTREMTIVGSRRMIVYDDVANLDKIRIFDARVDSPPHYDTFAEFHYAYHYGDIYIPYVKQEEPLKVECQHFLDCIRTGATPISSGHQARDMVEILEAASRSLDHNGAPVSLRDAHHPHHNGNGLSPSRPVKAQIKATNGAEPVAPTPTESPRANGRKTSRKTTLSVKTP
jgi:predicted dehydrogenase